MLPLYTAISLILLTGLCWAQPLPPTELRVEYLPSPVLGVDVPNPRFTWLNKHAQPTSQGQTAFQIWVSNSPSIPFGDVWDSGIVQSNASANRPFAGQSLLSDTSYYFKVRWWDSNQVASNWSTTGLFHTGLFNSADWKASWITGFNVMRKNFVLISAPLSAKVFVCAAGYYELHLNGHKVGTNQLDPGVSQYSKRLVYVVHEVTEHLRKGNNTIGLLLGGGWWNQVVSTVPPMGLVQMHSISQEGESTFVLSNQQWEGTRSWIVSNSIYNGETYDARLEVPGWDRGLSGDAPWAPVSIATPPTGALRAQMIPAIQIVETRRANKVSQPQQDVYVFDFDQNLSGFCTISEAKGPAGTQLTLRHAELLNHNGSGVIYTDNLRSALATDTYILKGTGGEGYTPRFTYHGFRFVELTGWIGQPSLNHLACHHVHTNVPRAGRLDLGVSVLNRLWKNIRYTQSSNLMSIPTDCDQRDERLGWTADAHLSSDEAIHNFDMAAFYTNWLNLIEDDAQNKTLTDTVPFMRFGYRPGDPAWTAALFIVTHKVYEYYGDTQVIATHYATMQAYLDWYDNSLKQRGLGGILSHYSDWIPPAPFPRASGNFTSSCFLLESIRLMANFAGLLGRQSEAKHYALRFQQLSAEFNQLFYNPSTVTYDIGVQTTFVLPLWLGIVPAQALTGVQDSLISDIQSQYLHLDTGILGAKYILPVLTNMGRDDLATELVLQTSYPSWIYPIIQTIEVPATTVWELWEGDIGSPSMDSRSHPVFGSVGHWLYWGLAGIRQSPKTAGYTSVAIVPPSLATMAALPVSYANAGIHTIQGNVSVLWRKQGAEQCSMILQDFDGQIECGQSGGVIEEISFAHNCRSSQAHVEPSLVATACQDAITSCIGSSRCDLSVLSPKCVEQAKLSPNSARTFVRAKCSLLPSLYLETTIPLSSKGTITLRKLGLANVTVSANSQVIFRNGMYTGGVAGITGARDDGAGNVLVSTSSGSFTFDLVGTSAASRHIATSTKDGQIRLSCPANSRVSFIRHAALKSALSLDYYSHNYLVAHVAERLCLHKSHCSFSTGQIATSASERSLLGETLRHPSLAVTIEHECTPLDN